MESQQREILKQLLELKQSSLKQFAVWNKQTRINLKNSKNILDKLFKRIDMIIKSSQVRYDLVLEFFKKMQFQVSSSIQFSKNINNFEVVNLIQENGQMIQNKNETFKKGIKCFEKNFNSFQDEVKLFEKRIEIQIINKILARKFQETEKDLEKKCNKIEKHNKILQKISLDTKNLQSQFLQVYQMSIKKNSKVNFDQSFLLEQFLALLSNIFKISSSLQQFSDQFFSLHQETVSLEKIRNNAIKDSLVVFINMVHNFYGEEKSRLFRESKELLLNISLDQFAEDSFDIKKLLNKDEINTILLQTDQQQLDMNTVKQYLNQCLEIDQQIILQDFYIQKFQGTALSGIKSKYLKISLFLDHNLNYYIYLMDNETIKELKYKFRLQDCRMKTDYQSSSIKIEFKDKGWFWSSSKNVEIRFDRDDLEICKSVFRNYNSAFNQNVDEERRMSEQIRQVDLSITDTSFDNTSEQTEPVQQNDLNDNEEVQIVNEEIIQENQIDQNNIQLEDNIEDNYYEDVPLNYNVDNNQVQNHIEDQQQHIQLQNQLGDQTIQYDKIQQQDNQEIENKIYQ